MKFTEIIFSLLICFSMTSKAMAYCSDDYNRKALTMTKTIAVGSGAIAYGTVQLAGLALGGPLAIIPLAAGAGLLVKSVRLKRLSYALKYAENQIENFISHDPYLFFTTERQERLGLKILNKMTRQINRRLTNQEVDLDTVARILGEASVRDQFCNYDNQILGYRSLRRFVIDHILNGTSTVTTIEANDDDRIEDESEERDGDNEIPGVI